MSYIIYFSVGMFCIYEPYNVIIKYNNNNNNNNVVIIVNFFIKPSTTFRPMSGVLHCGDGRTTLIGHS